MKKEEIELGLWSLRRYRRDSPNEPPTISEVFWGISAVDC